ncbi:MAG TPA: S53 family peptidase [Polyangiaceae bacterium]
MTIARALLGAALGACLVSCTSGDASPPSSSYVPLSRSVHSFARPELDRGPLDPARRIANLSLVFKLSPAQRADREALKHALLDPASPSYHRWFTPEAYAARFGAKPADVARASGWLASQGLEVHGASRLASRISFSGTVDKLEAAFRAPIHRFEVHGAMHYAMTAPPQVPADLADVVLDVTHTHDFVARPVPEYTTGGNTGFAPPDWANVYDVAPLYTTGVGGQAITGTGVTVAIVGLAPFAQSDVDAWRSKFGLPPSTVNMTLVPNTGAAQSGNGGGAAGILQVEWAGGIAPGATVDYVYTGADDANPDDGAYYVLENDLASVLIEAGGTCENTALQAGFTTGDQSIVDVYASAANILGITYVAPAGDEGATGCLAMGGSPGLYVDMPASYPGVTAVGGTEFATGSFVTGANGYFTGYSTNEHTWNDQNNDMTGVAATGGGISSLFSRPDYQSALPTCPIVGTLPTGAVPANMRQLPDVSFTAGSVTATNIPSFFECTLSGTDCATTGGTPQLVTAAGTSLGASAFAGVVALMDQLAGGRLGNINPLLYGLQASAPSAFHDITAGNNEVTCDPGSDPGCPAAGLYGYGATTGYDCTTGLGSVDAKNLLGAMAALAPTTAALVATPTMTSPGTPVALTATITVPTPNANALAGNVAFVFQSYTATDALDLSWTVGTSTITAGTVASGVATVTAPIPAGLVGGIPYVDVYARYEGDPTHLPSRSSNARIYFSPSTLCVSPATASVGTATNLTFTAMGGATPVTWFVRHDSTCDSTGSFCSSIDPSLGTFVSGPHAGWVVVGALDADGAEQVAYVTVGSPDAGSPPWGSMGTPPGDCTMSLDGGTDAAGPPDAATGDSGKINEAGPEPIDEAGSLRDSGMPSDAGNVDAASDGSGPGTPDTGADASQDASEDAGEGGSASGGGSGSSSGCGCIVPAGDANVDSPLVGALSTLAIAVVAARRRRRTM